jgi:hypothetical protein
MSSFSYRRGEDRAFIMQCLDNFVKANPADQYDIKITKYKEDRSLEQNKFFHGPLLDAFVRATGETDREYLKYSLKEKFLRVLVSSETASMSLADQIVDDAKEMYLKSKEYGLNSITNLIIEFGRELKVLAGEVDPALKTKKDLFYVRETKSLSKDEFQKFINDCKEYLMDIGGDLESAEYDSYLEAMGQYK